MQYRCSDLGIDDTSLRCSLFSSLVQPVLSYGCEIWGLEHAKSWDCIFSVHHLFLKRTLYVRKLTPTEAVMCELGQMPLHLFWRKLLLRFVGRVVDLPGSRLVKKAFMQAQQSCTPWFQKISAGYMTIIPGTAVRRHLFIFNRLDLITGHLGQPSLSVNFH